MSIDGLTAVIMWGSATVTVGALDGAAAGFPFSHPVTAVPSTPDTNAAASNVRTRIDSPRWPREPEHPTSTASTGAAGGCAANAGWSPPGGPSNGAASTACNASACTPVTDLGAFGGALPARR